jgi:anhydro-N-acetylmuramic acid kinase
MSGTSLDGIDVAVVDISGRRTKIIAHTTTPYPSKVREQILAVSNCDTHTANIARINFMLPELYASAVRKCGVPLDTIELAGCHGQTVFHEDNSTLQLGDGSILAERLGIPVVSDFRPRDMAAGGKGAPLVPFVDYRLYAHAKLGRVSLNIGGIANITAIPAAATPDDVTAFDTGPGNMVMDQLVAIHTKGARHYDESGAIAARGRLNHTLLNRLQRSSYFRRKPPKTAGREQYGKEFIEELLAAKDTLPNLITTATAFTAASIARGINDHVSHRVDEVIASGGGVHNQTLMAYLQAFLPETKVRISSEFGIDSDAKEAIAFAILAYETWHKRPSNLPSATGARRPVVLGKISY